MILPACPCRQCGVRVASPFQTLAVGREAAIAQGLEEHDELAGMDVEVDVMEREDLGRSAPVGLGQAARDEDGSPSFVSRGVCRSRAHRMSCKMLLQVSMVRISCSRSRQFRVRGTERLACS
jgi:hypothetical protein